MKTWTEEEIDVLVKNYNKVTNDELIKLIPAKTFSAIYKKAYKLGLRKTKEMEFRNRSNAQSGEKCNFWNGGVIINKKGYRMIHMPSHKRADVRGYVMEHILIFEEKTGIEVPAGCCVHHINENKSDNRIENLCMMTNGAHSSLHNRKRGKK